MEQITNQRLITVFSECVLNPAAINAADTAYLVSLSNKFPCCQILYAFIGRSTIGGGADFDQRLSAAALYSPDRNVLHMIVNRPGALLTVKMEENQKLSKQSDYKMPDIHAETKTLIEQRLVNTSSSEIEEKSTSPTEPVIEHGSKGFIEDTIVSDLAKQSIPDIHAETRALIEERMANKPFSEIEDSSTVSEEVVVEHELKDDIENILSEDTVAQLADVVEKPINVEQQMDEDAMMEKKVLELDHHEVSKYDDDKMPYSFLWWLNKTRKEHSGIYQPYLKLQSDLADTEKHATEGLGHQIAENIFYQQSAPLKDLENQGVDVNHLTFKRKEESVLDKFIQEDPQIKPPKPENLSIENKARQSAQDLNDLVSETLAEIYTGQMLFDKAIDTYKKLSLKFPEKSAYFAQLIDNLEKKLNK